jgi:glyoxylase-like metal-dependent hydrolase (beta-lactamase superfamily II)
MRIHAIETGRVRIKQAQIEGRGHGTWRQLQPILSSEWADWSPVYAWAIEHPEGVIVVDTGAAAHLKSLPRWHPYFQFAVRFDIEPEQEVGPQLRRLGIGARDVKTVVLTHLHIDHDGGLAHFPHSRILGSAGEIARASGIGGAVLGYLPKRWPKWFAPEPLAWQPTAYGPFASSARISAAETSSPCRPRAIRRAISSVVAATAAVRSCWRATPVSWIDDAERHGRRRQPR